MFKWQFLCCGNDFMCQGSFAQVSGCFCHPVSDIAVQPYSTLGMQQQRLPGADGRQPQLVVPISQFVLHLSRKSLRLLCCAKIPFSFEVDRYNGQPANNRLTFIDALLPEREPPVIVGLETAAEMNLVQIETNEFFLWLANYFSSHRACNVVTSFRRVSTGCAGGR